jgi:hypothetical protein
MKLRTAARTTARTTARTPARAAATALLVGAAVTVAGAGTAAAAPGQAVYTGQASITIESYGYCGFAAEPQLLGRQTYTAPATLTTSGPVSDGDGGAETNPIHFTLQTDQQYGTGAFAVTTGQVATTPESGRRLSVQYWTTEYDSATGALAGVLTEDHREEALAYNAVQVEQLLIPCRPSLGTIPMAASMAEGTQLAGALDADGGTVEIAGQSHDGLTRFHVSTSLTRG